jgi:hypothetical protein
MGLFVPKYGASAGGGGGGGSGTVTSVALTVPAELAVAGSPITGAGTLAVTRVNQNPNLVMAGPASGVAAAPGYRALVSADIPNNAANTSGNAATATSASSAAVANALAGTLAVGGGGTGATALAAHGVLVGAGSSAVAVTAIGTAGQVLTSNGASADPTWQAAAGGGVSNPLTLTAATGVSAQILAAGVDTNVSLLLVPKGSGQVRLFADAYTPGIGLFCGSSPAGLQVQQAGSANLADLIARTLFAGSATVPPATLGYSGHGLDLAADKMVQWSNTTGDATQAKDTILSRPAAGVVSLDTTASGNHAGWYNYGGTSRVAADLTNATATMAAITGLSATLAAGRFYLVRMVIKGVNSQATEGLQFDFNGGTATMTDFWMGAGILASGGTDVIGTNVSTSLSGAITFTTFTGESVIVFEGYLKVNAAGTLIPRFAENTSAAGTATVRKGSLMVLVDTP